MNLNTKTLSATVDHISEKMICQSSLVDKLLEKEIIYYDDILNLYTDNEDEPQEIFEWWIVDSWLADKLIEV